MLTLRDVTKTFNARTLFSKANMTVNYAEREEVALKLVFDRSEVANPPRNGLIVISAEEGYRIGQTEPPDGITIMAEVSRLSASELAGKTLPGDL